MVGSCRLGTTSTWTGAVDVQGTTIPLRFGDDYAPASLRVDPQTRVDASPLVFVGYGVQAPEYGWDDYKGMDVRGKTLLMLVNDPQIPDPANPSQLDAKMFKGRAMTYYGRWTYKFEIASRLGAAAVLLVHETGPAGYPWEVPKAGAGMYDQPTDFEINGTLSNPANYGPPARWRLGVDFDF